MTTNELRIRCESLPSLDEAVDTDDLIQIATRGHEIARELRKILYADKPCGWVSHDIVHPIDIGGNIVALTVREFTVTNRDELDWAIAELLRKRDLLEES